MVKVERLALTFFVWFGILIIPIFSMGQEINKEGWPIPDLKGLIPYSITIKVWTEWRRSSRKFIHPVGDISQG